jgi:hypothetical protein
MFELILRCIGYAFMAAFWLGIFFASRAAMRAVHLRHFGRAAGFCIVVIGSLWAGLFVGFTPGASAYQRYRHIRDLFGVGVTLGPVRHEYFVSVGFGGGYHIRVREIPDSLSRWALSPPPEFTAAHPVRRSRDSGSYWHPTPLAAAEQKYLRFILLEQGSSLDLSQAQQLLERLANEPGNYVAYSYRESSSTIADVDFYLLSPSQHVFISASSYQ